MSKQKKLFTGEPDWPDGKGTPEYDAMTPMSHPEAIHSDQAVCPYCLEEHGKRFGCIICECGWKFCTEAVYVSRGLDNRG